MRETSNRQNNRTKRTASTIKRTKRTVSTPAISDETIEKRLLELGVTFSEYVNALISYDCWAQKPHTLTGDATKGDKIDEERLWREIIVDFGKANKVGSYFEHRAKEFVLSQLKAPPPAA